MLRALREQNRILAGKIKSKLTHRDLIKPLAKIDPYHEFNRLDGNRYEYLFHGGDAFEEAQEFLNEEGIYYEVAQDNSRSSTKILEIDFDEQD